MNSGASSGPKTYKIFMTNFKVTFDRTVQLMEIDTSEFFIFLNGLVYVLQLDTLFIISGSK